MKNGLITQTRKKKNGRTGPSLIYLRRPKGPTHAGWWGLDSPLSTENRLRPITPTRSSQTAKLFNIGSKAEDYKTGQLNFFSNATAYAFPTGLNFKASLNGVSSEFHEH
jgi:hypothetical protein